MTTKTSKITVCTFNNVWNPPTGGTLYLHSISFENGDNGKIYATSQMPPNLIAGQMLTYTISEKLQVKVVEQPTPQNNNNSNTPITKPFTSPKQTDIIGLSFSYAKDIMVAQIAQGVLYKKVPEDFIKIAIPIYNKMQELRENLISKEDK
jgi:hypothetical protein